jgi:GDP/UDP-N,N'-diacetylbacillosamine 2-epimerase (hydrolysing)
MTNALEAEGPDMVLVLGDRGEMLAGALAAVHLNIHLAHIHGGERSGTLDESLRHAISKLSHFHMVSTDGARQRLIRMGEKPEHIFVTGAPGLDGILEAASLTREELCRRHGLDARKPIALVVFHPVIQEAEMAQMQMAEIMGGLHDIPVQALCMTPNSDAGGQSIRALLEQRAQDPGVKLKDHFTRAEFLSWLASCDVMVGNSSAGIIEAASLGTPVVNVGSRQKARERSDNVIDVPPLREAVLHATADALARGRRAVRNVYGDGQAGKRIVELLATLPLDRTVLSKSNAY